MKLIFMSLPVEKFRRVSIK